MAQGSHEPGALYADEGSTNWNITHNVIQGAPAWLQGCRPGCAWIGPLWQDYNWFDAASAGSINVEARVSVSVSAFDPDPVSVSVLGSVLDSDAVSVRDSVVTLSLPVSVCLSLTLTLTLTLSLSLSLSLSPSLGALPTRR